MDAPRRRGRPTAEEALKRKKTKDRQIKFRLRKQEKQMREEAELMSRVPDLTGTMSNADLAKLPEDLQLLQLNHETAERLGIKLYIVGESESDRNDRIELAALKADGFESLSDYEFSKMQRVAKMKPSRPITSSKPHKPGLSSDQMAKILEHREKEKADLLNHMIETDNPPSWLTEQLDEEN